MRMMRRGLRLAGMVVAAGLIFSSGLMAADDQPQVHVKAVVKDGAVTVEAQASGPFDYTSYRPSANLFVIDLSGVSAGDPTGARVVSSDLVKGYRVLTYSAGQKSIVRVEILLSDGVEPKIERKDAQDISLVVSRNTDASTSSPLAPGPSPAVVRTVASTPETESPGTPFESIQQVNLAQNGDQTDVEVIGTGPLTYHETHLQNPDRLVLDFSGSHLKTSEKHIASNLDPVREIRLAQFSPEVSRMVIDLRQPSRYSINTSGNAVTVSFDANASDGSVKSTPVAPSTESNLTKTKTEPPKKPAVQTADSKAPAVPAPAVVLPTALTQTSAALGTPVATPSRQSQAVGAPSAPQTVAYNVPNTPAPSQPASIPQQQEGIAATRLANQASVAAAANVDSAPPARPAPIVPQTRTPDPQVDSQAVTPAAGTKFSGEPISVNLKDVDLRDFFRLIHEISGLNVVVDPSVKGTLTIVLDDVPWDQALDIVLHNNDLDKQLEGNVLRIATKDTIRKEAEETRDLAKAQAEAADVVTTTRRLSYAKATLMAATLKKFLSSRGDILADDRSNTLIIRDIPATFPVVDNLLRQLDRKSQQVEIEARVVSASRQFSRELGAAIGVAARAGNSLAGGDGTVGNSSLNFERAAPPITTVGSTTTGPVPLITNLASSVPTSGVQYAFQSANFALDAILDAAEARGVGKLLSKPKVITQNNEKATVKQGTKIPVQTVINNTVSVQFVDAVLELDVTPQITAEGTIYMDVTVENDQIDQGIPRVEGIPAIDTQSTETKVTVTDGSTVVIGGIIVTQQNTTIEQVPILGSVPVLGNLFKHTSVSSTSSELLFFLTPRILPG